MNEMRESASEKRETEEQSSLRLLHWYNRKSNDEGQLIVLKLADYPAIDLYLNKCLKPWEIAKVLKKSYPLTARKLKLFWFRYLYYQHSNFFEKRDEIWKEILMEMKAILEEFKNIHITSNFIWDQLSIRLPHLTIPHPYSIRRYLKSYLKFSYRRINHIYTPSLNYKELLYKSQFVYIYKLLMAEGVRLIFLDEFAV